jgi:hypothetical protein
MNPWSGTTTKGIFNPLHTPFPFARLPGRCLGLSYLLCCPRLAHWRRYFEFIHLPGAAVQFLCQCQWLDWPTWPQ